MMADKPASPEAFIRLVYNRALGRDPAPGEMDTARSAFDSPPSAQNAEDFLWAVFMLPEFQLIR